MKPNFSALLPHQHNSTTVSFETKPLTYFVSLRKQLTFQDTTTGFPAK